MRKIFTSLVLLVAVNSSINAQFFNYLKANAVNAGNLAYTDLGTNGTVITTNFKGLPMTFDDDNSSVKNIGFTFGFSGTNFTQFVLNTNGFIKLGNDTTAIAESFDVLNSTDASAKNVIYALNTNLKSTVNTEYRVYTTGVAGSRTCTIQFKGVMDNGYAAASPSTVVQFDYIEFQIILYEGSNNVEFVYGNFTANLDTPGFIPTNCGLKAGDAAHSLNATKSSQTVFTGATFIEGAYTGNSFNIRNSLLPNPGFTLRFVPITIYNDNVAVQRIYTQGKIPKNLDHTIKAYVQNIGTVDKTNFPVTLTISGANVISQTQTIANLVSGSKQLVTFNTISPANTGTQLITVSVQNDDFNGNNFDTVTQVVTNSTIGFGYGNAVSGVLGQSTNSIDFAAKFTNPIANSITSITTYFDTSGRAYRLQVFGVNSDTPKVTISNLGNKTSVVGANVITPTTPINVTGDFFIVVTQPSTTTSYRYRYQTEDPIREKTFFFRTPSAATGSKWNDFAPLNPFRLMVDVTMTNSYLPIKLNCFSGSRQDRKNILKWETYSEINSEGFEIQRSLDGKEFAKIGFVESKAINGSSSSAIEYGFTDIKPSTGINFYRLKQIDKDGKESFSEIINIKNDGNIKAEIVSIYPNPAKENISISLNSNDGGNYTIHIADITGKIVGQQFIKSNVGNNKIQFATSTYSSGTYFVKILSEDKEEIATTKFIKL